MSSAVDCLSNQVLLYILNITVIGNNSIETRQVPGVMLGYFGDLGIGTTTGQIFGCLRERNVGSLKTTFGYASKETAAGEFQCPSQPACVEGRVTSMADSWTTLS